jgi:hypothetical protein
MNMKTHQDATQRNEDDASAFPFQLHWTSQELADAVPLRLHEMFGFQAGHDGAQTRSANSTTRAMPSSHARRDRGYLLATALPYFRIH